MREASMLVLCLRGSLGCGVFLSSHTASILILTSPPLSAHTPQAFLPARRHADEPHTPSLGRPQQPLVHRASSMAQPRQQDLEPMPPPSFDSLPDIAHTTIATQGYRDQPSGRLASLPGASRFLWRKPDLHRVSQLCWQRC